MDKGEYQNALVYIDKLPEKIKVEGMIFKSQTLVLLGMYDNAIKLAMSAVDISHKHNRKGLEIGARAILAKAILQLGEIQKSADLIENAEKLMDELDIQAKTDSSYWIGLFLDAKGMILHQNGILDEAQDYWLKALSIFNKLEENSLLAMTYMHLGMNSQKNGDVENALNSFFSSLAFSSETKNGLTEAMTLATLGEHYFLKGEIALALTNAEKSAELLEDYGNRWHFARVLNLLGRIYRSMGQNERALEKYQSSLIIREEIFNQTETSETIFDLFVLTIEMKDYDLADRYLDKLKTINYEANNTFVNLRYRIGKGLYFKESENLVAAGKSISHFRKIVNETVIDINLSIFAMINLTDLLLLELKIFGKQLVLDEVLNLSNQIVKLAHTQESSVLLVQSYLLRSKLALIELKIKEANKFIEKASEIANESSLLCLLHTTNEFKETMINQIDKWDYLIDSEATIDERVALAELETTLTQMVKNKVDQLAEVQDEAVMILLVSSTGVTCYSRSFRKESEFDESLIGSFLGAINDFVKATFNVTGSIDRIKHDDYTMMVKQRDLVNFWYVFKGSSYHALRKLEKLITVVEKNDSIWSSLNNELPSILISDIKVLDNISDRILDGKVNGEEVE